jgi:hypothetical protein
MSRFFDSEIAKTDMPQRGAECAYDDRISQTENKQILIYYPEGSVSKPVT